MNNNIQSESSYLYLSAFLNILDDLEFHCNTEDKCCSHVLKHQNDYEKVHCVLLATPSLYTAQQF